MEIVKLVNGAPNIPWTLGLTAAGALISVAIDRLFPDTFTWKSKKIEPFKVLSPQFAGSDNTPPPTIMLYLPRSRIASTVNRGNNSYIIVVETFELDAEKKLLVVEGSLRCLGGGNKGTLNIHRLPNGNERYDVTIVLLTTENESTADSKSTTVTIQQVFAPNH